MAGEQYTKEDVSALIRAAQRLCGARDIETIIEVVRSTARGLVGADGATMVLREGDRVFYAAEDAIAPLWQGRRFPASACISGWAMLNRQSVTLEDIYEDRRIPIDAYLSTFVRSLAVVPVNREDPIAAIGVYWAQRHTTTERELELLQSLADAAATAVANSDLYRSLVLARSELEHAGTRLRLALEAGAIGTWDYNPITGAMSWDAKAAELFGVLPDAATDYPFFLACVHSADRERVRMSVDNACASSSNGQYDIEHRVQHVSAAATTAADSGERWLAARGRVQFDLQGRAERFVGTLRDVTAQKQVEAERVELLRRANEANLAKDEFLAMLGHELRNPLAPIVTAVELLKLRGQGNVREVETIERQSQHLTRLVDDLLDIARVTRGKLELKRRRVQLHAVVSKAIELAAPLIESRSHVLELAVDSDVYVDGDEFRLAQLLANLLTNAAKYTPPAGHIRICAQVSGRDVSIVVQDSGCGISADLLPRLFAPFVQANQSFERSQGGLGLGLALARSLAELHGGHLEAESPGVDQGSTFTVCLPIAAAQRERVDEAHGAALPMIAAARHIDIVVVDDNEDAAELLAAALSHQGHNVRVALDPVEALALIREAVPDVALLDLGLPVMDGYELAEQLRTELGARCPALIAITGYGQEKDRQRSSEAGFALHLVKPVQTSTVLDALTRVTPLLRRRSDREQHVAE